MDFSDECELSEIVEFGNIHIGSVGSTTKKQVKKETGSTYKKPFNEHSFDKRLYMNYALTICDSIGLVGKNEEHKSIWKSLLSQCTTDIFEATADADAPVAHRAEELEVDPLYQKAKNECILNDGGAEKVTTISENADAHRFPALLGTMTHRLMEILVSTKKAYDANQAIDEIIREYRTPKNQPFEGKLTDALMGVVQVMENGGYAQDNGAPQDILNVLLGAEEVYCEGGNWHIIDYKTNIAGGNLDHKYKAQLEAYKKALKATTGNDADTEVIRKECIEDNAEIKYRSNK